MRSLLPAAPVTVTVRMKAACLGPNARAFTVKAEAQIDPTHSGGTATEEDSMPGGGWLEIVCKTRLTTQAIGSS